jgi:hypothetical protein
MVLFNIRIPLFTAALLCGVAVAPLATDAQPYPYYPAYGYPYACPYGYPCYYPGYYYAPYPWDLGVGIDIGGGWGHGGWGHRRFGRGGWHGGGVRGGGSGGRH